MFVENFSDFSALQIKKFAPLEVTRPRGFQPPFRIVPLMNGITTFASDRSATRARRPPDPGGQDGVLCFGDGISKTGDMSKGEVMAVSFVLVNQMHSAVLLPTVSQKQGKREAAGLSDGNWSWDAPSSGELTARKFSMIRGWDPLSVNAYEYPGEIVRVGNTVS